MRFQPTLPARRAPGGALRRNGSAGAASGRSENTLLRQKGDLDRPQLRDPAGVSLLTLREGDEEPEKGTLSPSAAQRMCSEDFFAQTVTPSETTMQVAAGAAVASMSQPRHMTPCVFRCAACRAAGHGNGHRPYGACVFLCAGLHDLFDRSADVVDLVLRQYYAGGYKQTSRHGNCRQGSSGGACTPCMLFKRQIDRERVAKSAGFASAAAMDARHEQNMKLMREGGVGALVQVYRVTSMAEVDEALDAILMQRTTLAETNEAE